MGADDGRRRERRRLVNDLVAIGAPMIVVVVIGIVALLVITSIVFGR